MATQPQNSALKQGLDWENRQECEWKQEMRNNLILDLPVLFLFCFFFYCFHFLALLSDLSFFQVQVFQSDGDSGGLHHHRGRRGL